MYCANSAAKSGCHRDSAGGSDEIAGGPEDAALVLAACRLAVLAEDVELVRAPSVEQPVDDLLRRPCAGGLVRAPARSAA